MKRSGDRVDAQVVKRISGFWLRVPAWAFMNVTAISPQQVTFGRSEQLYINVKPKHSEPYKSGESLATTTSCIGPNWDFNDVLPGYYAREMRGNYLENPTEANLAQQFSISLAAPRSWSLFRKGVVKATYIHQYLLSKFQSLSWVLHNGTREDYICHLLFVG